MVRLLGVTVVVVAQPGERTDSARRGYDAATRCSHLAGVATEDSGNSPGVGERGRTRPPGGRRWRDRPRACGPPARRGASSPGRPRGLVLAGSDGFDDPELPDVITSSVPGIDWTVVGGKHWVPDVRDHLAHSDVVVTHAGQNAIADVAGWALPAVVVPQSRPFDEQRHLGAVLASSGIAQVVQGDDVEGAGWASSCNRPAPRGRGWRLGLRRSGLARSLSRRGGRGCLNRSPS